MSDLAAFILARLAEREAAARAATAGPWRWADASDTVREDSNFGLAIASVKNSTADGVHIARHDPAWVLADVAAKRAIVERYMHLAEHGDSGDARWVLPLLAQPDAGHPDFDPAWRV